MRPSIPRFATGVDPASAGARLLARALASVVAFVALPPLALAESTSAPKPNAPSVNVASPVERGALRASLIAGTHVDLAEIVFEEAIDLTGLRAPSARFSCRGCRLTGGVDLSGSTLGAVTLAATQAGVLRLDGGRFSSVEVRGGAIATFSARRAAVGDLSVSGTEVGALVLDDATLTEVNLVGAQLELLRAPHAIVSGALRQSRGTVGELNLEFTRIGRWLIDQTTLPHNGPGAVRLHGLTYDYWLLGDDWRLQLGLLDRGVHAKSAYDELARMLQQQGYRPRADAVRRAWRARERATLWAGGGVHNRLRSIALGVDGLLTGHGTQGYLLIGWLALQLLVGRLIFRDAPEPLGTALDYLPLSPHLGLASEWHPSGVLQGVLRTSYVLASWGWLAAAVSLALR